VPSKSLFFDFFAKRLDFLLIIIYIINLILLCGGDKSTQQRDIDRAKKLKSEVTP
jgi:putative component of toxin-antitoxin plasmid stabilization module